MNQGRPPRDPERSAPDERTVAVRPGLLDELADRVGRLAPRHRDPEAFHVEKSEIEAELRRLARRISGA